MANHTTSGHPPRLDMPPLSKTSLLFAALLAGFTLYFMIWGARYTEGHQTPLFILATLFGLFMAFNIGGNDVANSFGTSVGAGTLTIRQALLVAAIFEVSGAVIAGGEVTQTIRGGIVDLGAMAVTPQDFIFIMTSALIAAAFWLLYATRKGYPVSTTHSIVGAIVGSSIVLGILMSGTDAALSLVHWDKIGQIAISWVLSPVLGGLVAYTLFFQIKKHILSYNERADEVLQDIRQEKQAHKHRFKEAFERLSEIQKISYTQAMARDMQALTDRDFRPDDLESDYYRELYAIDQRREHLHAHRALEQWVPVIAAVGAMIITSMLLFKGLEHMNIGLSTLHNYLVMGMIGAAVWMATFIFAKTLKSESLGRATFLIFSWMQVFTASGFAFSHGSNDIANAIGPFAAILGVLKSGEIGSEAAIPTLAMVTFGVALIAGLWFIGKEVIQTVGHNLTAMHPASGFSAELSAAAVVMAASLLGLPVSSTHILIGAVLGIGLVNRQTNWALMRPIALAWVITLPAAAVISAVAFLLLRAIF
ncbi:PiT family inorganic phosphate transporter [Pseudomonas duriflava]|uniref:Phosphate transporter n=1 Tax=Pseudomonas duriflava TaxID=459528 RepID=A0A562QN28_9PSED|nr:inorganic phosphate transporter [Pseudomonas duriflava]TWI57466.1 PiT family inorganic phosphate transporter [Pseudomonas duriflava]